MSLPEFHAAVMSGLQAAKKMMEESEQAKQKLAEFERFQAQNAKLSEENAALKKELDNLKNTIALSKEQVAQITEGQRQAIRKELEDWNDKIYWSKDRELDNANPGSYHQRIRRHERNLDENKERRTFIQKLMTILGE